MKEKDIEESKKDEVFKEGLEYKIFLKNHFKYQGTLLSVDIDYIKIFDTKEQIKIIIPRQDISILLEVKK